MHDPVTHVNIAAPVVSGGISLMLSHLFDIPPDLLLIAFIGAWIGIALRDPVPDFVTKLEAVKFFFKTLVVVLIGTIAAAYLIPFFLQRWPEGAVKSISAFTGFGLVYFYVQIIELLKFAFTEAKGAISRLFGKVG